MTDRAPDDLAAVYSELRGVARRMLARESHAQTLESVDLVNLAWIRILGGDLRDLAEADPRKVLALAVLNMRRELVDRARRRRAQKRPDPRARVNLADAPDLAERDPDLLLEVDRLIDELATDPKIRSGARKAEAARYALYGGFSENEISEILDMPKSTVGADLRFVRAYLAGRLAEL